METMIFEDLAPLKKMFEAPRGEGSTNHNEIVVDETMVFEDLAPLKKMFEAPRGEGSTNHNEIVVG